VTAAAPKSTTIDEDLENWDENEQDWSDDEPTTNGGTVKPPLDVAAIAKKD
jgi:hypothetical protein